MKKKPNVLLIMTDQQRGDCLSIEGHPVLMTPNMDSIGGRGVRFTGCYTPCPTCIAARRTLLSGQFPVTHGIVGYQDGTCWEAPPTLPEVLRDAGYHTYLVGRDMHQFPERKRYGYDHMVTQWDYSRHLEGKVPDIYGRKANMHSSMYHTAGVMHNDWTARPWHMDEALHFTDWTVNEALRFLDNRDPACPFFLTVSFLAPHPPLTPPSFYMERYLRCDLPRPIIGDWAVPPTSGGLGDDVSSDRVMLEGERLRSCMAGYFGLINHVDDQIRRLLNPIDGIDRRDTVVLFTSDHGEMLGDHYLWRKTLPYEGSARVPLMIAMPESFGIDGGYVVDSPVCLADIMPTVLDLLDIPIPATVEGESLAPLMRREHGIRREYLHIEHAPLYHCLTDGREKYIWFVRDGREQLFDLERDPEELHDCIADDEYRGIVSLWRKRLVGELADRPEGFVSNGKLVAGRPYPAVLQRRTVNTEEKI